MPDWKDEIRRRLANLRLEATREAEIVEELSQHLDDRYQELMAGGATPDEAHRVAIAELSESEALARELKRVERPVQREPVVLGVRRTNMLEDLWQDLRYGLRMLAKNPGFTLIAVFTLALGIGANTAIFSLVNAVLLRPLPYPESDRLVLLMQSYPEKGLDYWTLSQANVAAYRDQSSVFEAIAAYMNGGANLTGSGEPERIQVTSVSADFFKVFSVTPVLGRAFLPGEDTPGKDSVCVLSYSFWQRRFGGDLGVIGRPLLLNDVPKEIVGVMPEGFSFPPRWIEVAVWTPLVLDPQRQSPFGLRAVARLKSGVSASEAQAETTAILWNNAQQSPGFVASAQAPQPGAGLKTLVTPLKEAIIGETDKPLVLLLGAVGLVLLICCANVANLLLARAVSRTKEISVRLALGATPGRIIRQLVTESLLLALIGAVAGTALAWWGVDLLGWLPVRGIPRINEA
ncbi:MAG TPA: ABC transporter permease, partial [Blastocatellia bacterium]|nr:ABC transporter permease [Blastocatellia bacterium]